MTVPEMRLAHPEDTGRAKPRAVERTLGTHLGAFEPAETRAARWDDQERRLVALEQELDVVLVVFQRDEGAATL
jgi:hypothetical protein